MLLKVTADGKKVEEGKINPQTPNSEAIYDFSSFNIKHVYSNILKGQVHYALKALVLLKRNRERNERQGAKEQEKYRKTHILKVRS